MVFAEAVPAFCIFVNGKVVEAVTFTLINYHPVFFFIEPAVNESIGKVIIVPDYFIATRYFSLRSDNAGIQSGLTESTGNCVHPCP